MIQKKGYVAWFVFETHIRIRIFSPGALRP